MSSMQGFGSDSYQGYMGGGSGSTAYNPPAGYGGLSSNSSEQVLSSSSGAKWGAQPQQPTAYKPMGTHYSETPKLKLKEEAPASNPKTKESPASKPSGDRKKNRKQSSSSSESSEEETVKKPKKATVEKKEEVNLLELDVAPPKVEGGLSAFDFLGGSAPQKAEANLIDFLDTTPVQQQPSISQATLLEQFSFPQSVQQPQVQQQFFLQPMQQQNAINRQQQMFQTQQNAQPADMSQLFSNLNMKPTSQQQQDPSPSTTQAPVIVDDSKKDAWSMGRGLVNLGNLKQSQALPDPLANSFSNQSQPVYIKSAPTSQTQANPLAQPKFIPGVFMTPQMQSQQQQQQANVAPFQGGSGFQQNIPGFQPPQFMQQQKPQAFSFVNNQQAPK